MVDQQYLPKPTKEPVREVLLERRRDKRRIAAFRLAEKKADMSEREPRGLRPRSDGADELWGHSW